MKLYGKVFCFFYGKWFKREALSEARSCKTSDGWISFIKKGWIHILDALKFPGKLDRENLNFKVKN